MKISEAIKMLQRYKNHDEEIIIEWWDRDTLTVGDDSIPVDVWEEVCKRYNEWDDMDSYITTAIVQEIAEILSDDEPYDHACGCLNPECLRCWESE